MIGLDSGLFRIKCFMRFINLCRGVMNVDDQIMNNSSYVAVDLTLEVSATSAL